MAIGKLGAAVFAGLLGMVGADAAQAGGCRVPGNAAIMAKEVGQILNKQRQHQGLNQLKFNNRLTKAAERHACDMAANGYFSHTGRNGSSVKTRIDSTGYRACIAAENIAWGQRTPGRVMDTWMQSKGHRANILRGGVKEVGIALVQDDTGRPIWVQVFAKGCKA